MGHEERARSYHRGGNNCSQSVYRAYADEIARPGRPPAPRSVRGKCGALLAAQQVLEDMGIGGEDELERAFASELGHTLCRDLRRARVNCNDCVGVAARLVEERLA